MTIENPYSLEGKIVLVTGAGSGIGRATSIECSKLGATMVLVDINPDSVRETLGMLANQELDHQFFVCDLTNDEALDELVAKVPVLTGLVNNAGINKLLPPSFINREDINKIFSINTFAPIFLTQKLLRKKKIAAGASIVFTAALNGVYSSSPANSMYSASKGAINGFMKNLALDLAAKKIRCNSVNPGMIETDILRQGAVSSEEIEENKKKFPLGRWGKPVEIARGIIFLLSDASSWTTGTTLVIDGGVLLAR
jgi:NAD(P)-dependent dehydrogenase (short-subunit alcohol dehydrogenase family)